MRLAFTMARRHDKWLVPLIIITPIVVLGGFIALSLFVIGHIIYVSLIAVLFAFLATLVVFGRRATAAAYVEVEGRPGAAAGVLQGLRGAWRVQPAVAITRNQDFVHRAIGRPGVVLVGEGAPHRVGQLLVQEKRRVSRAVPEIPIYEVNVGDADGQVSIRKLQAHMNKLPRNMKPAKVRELDSRLRALGASQPPLPKGPIPGFRPGQTPRVPRGKR
ncbi:MAG: hypothetical protein QOG53_3354 [Frankiales bacterium]|nr:hypothetical protein [Frankiales bacterium]